MKTLKYKEFRGTINFSLEDGVLHGKVLDVNGLITYEGETLKKLEEGFQFMVDEHLKDCEKLNIPPKKKYSGNLNVRIGEELHSKASVFAERNHISLNKFIKQAIASKIGIAK